MTPTRLLSLPPSDGAAGRKTPAHPNTDLTPTQVALSPPSPGTAIPDTDVSLARLAELRLLVPGDRLGDYLLIERVGMGGMGEIWKAVHQRLGRMAAIKLMLQHSREAWARFEREARLAAGLDHPHIAKLYEFSLDPPFIAMQYIDGAPLHRTSADRIRALRDAALAVAHAHQRGVLHRDLKPDNILVDAHGEAFILDFGLARPVERAGEQLTVSGEAVGTPAFMAPEQALGEAGRIDARTDVYGLGATLYMILSGHPPFAGSGTWEVLHRVIDQEPAPPGGDRDLETICLAAMAKEPARRYSSALEFAAELTRWLAREPVHARRAGLGYRLWRSAQRRPAVWSLAVALALAVLGGAVFGVVNLVAARGSLTRALAAEQERGRAAAELVRSLEQQGQVEIEAKANLARALAAEQERGRAAAELAHGLELQGLVESARRELDGLDETMARELDDAGLAGAYDRIDELLARLARRRADEPGEGIFAGLAGEAELLRNREDAAIAAFDAALAAADGPVSRKLGARELASLGRARARLRRDFLDQMAYLFMFHNQSGYFAEDRDGRLVQADLDAAGVASEDSERQALGLWVGYLRAASSPDAYQQYTRIQAEAKALAAQGGRRNEMLHLLVGVLTPPPRTLDQVVAAYSAAIDRFHGLPQAWVLRAQERLFSGRKAEARADLDQALRLRPDYALARLMRASCAGEAATERAAALADLDQAVRLAPDQPMCWLMRGLQRHHLGQFKEALADVDAAIDADTAHPGFRQPVALWKEQAELQRQLGRDDLAIAAYRQAAGRGDQAARLTAARLLADAVGLAVGENELQGLLDETPPAANQAQVCCAAREWRAEARERGGNLAGALADCEWTIAHVPQHLPARVRRGLLLARLGRVAEAISGLDEAETLMRSWAEQAKSTGMAIARADGHIANVLVARAQVRADAGAGDAAQADCDQALALAPDHVQALELRARLRREAKMAVEADADAARAVGLLADWGDRLRAQADYLGAIAAYRRALAISKTERIQAALDETERLRAAAIAAATQPPSF